MFDPTKSKLVTSSQVSGILYGLCWDKKQSRLYGAGSDRAVYRVDLNAETPKAEKRWTNHENYVSALALLDDAVVSVSYDGRIIWTKAETGKQIRAVKAHGGWVRDVVVFPDGKRLASVADDMLVKVWNAETGACEATFEGHAKKTPEGYATALYALAITPDGNHLASGDRIGAVCIWEMATGRRLQQLHAPTFYTYDPKTRVRSIGGIRSLRFSPDGLKLAIAGIGQVTNVDGFVGPCRVELWDWRAGKHVQTFQDEHKAVINDVAFHPSAPYLIGAGGGDSGGILAFWELGKEQPRHKAKPKGHIQRLVLDADQQRLFLAGHDGFQIWNCGTA